MQDNIACVYFKSNIGNIVVLNRGFVMPFSKLDSLIEKGTETINTTLKRSVGLSGVVIISLSAMLPGIFVTPTFAAEIMGAGIWLVFIVAAAVVLPAAISKAELSSGMPSSGGSYVYLERTYGPLIGTISGL